MSKSNLLTQEEKLFVSIALVGSSHETDKLVAIIERLSGEKIVPADQVRGVRQ